MHVLDKPPFTPPGAAFPIAWTTLYILMAVAGYRVSHDRRSISFWGVQLALNAAWSPIFFGLRSPGLALIDIVALLAMIARGADWPGLLREVRQRLGQCRRLRRFGRRRAM